MLSAIFCPDRTCRRRPVRYTTRPLPTRPNRPVAASAQEIDPDVSAPRLAHRAGFVLICPLATAADPPPVDAGGVTGLDLKTQLEKGLYARRPVEFEYIDEIINLVEEGKLPRAIVTTTFVWARRTRRRLQYFQFAAGSPGSRPPRQAARFAQAGRRHQRRRRRARREHPADSLRSLHAPREENNSSRGKHGFPPS